MAPGRNNSGIGPGCPTVIVSRFSALGDVAMTIPVLYDVCRSWPGVRFVMLTKRNVAPMFINRPQNLTVDGIDLKSAAYSGPLGLWRLWRHVRGSYSPDVWIDLHDVMRTKVLRTFARMSGVKVAVIDKGRSDKRAIVAGVRRGRYRDGRESLPRLQSAFGRYASVFVGAGFAPTGSFGSLWDAAYAGQHDAEPSLPVADKQPGERWIAVAPFAAHRGKVYPVEQMEQVVGRLAADPATRVFLFGAGDEEREVLRRMAAQPRVMSMAEERHGFAVELAMIRRMDVMLSMDSANMHLAAMSGIPVVSIWGATHPCFGFEGWRQDPANSLGADGLDCRPCSVFGNRPCRRADAYACMRAISPDAVVARIDAVTGRRPTPTDSPSSQRNK